MSFGVVRFRRLLFVSCASLAVTNLMDMVDTMIAGHVLGDVALGAIGLFWPVVEILCFCATVVAGGTAILFSESVGAFDMRSAARRFSTGLTASVLIGLVFAATLFFGRDACLALTGAGVGTVRFLSPYWTVFAANAAFVPLSVYLSTMICADGDTAVCSMAFIAELAVNTVSSYFLCLRWGTAGCALGTVLGTLASLLVLSLHFLRPQNGLRFVARFSFRVLATAVRLDFPESAYLVFTGLVYVAMNGVLLARFGEGSLTVMAAVITANGLMYFFYGVSKAVQPIVGVYLSEGNHPAVRRLMREALVWALVLGGGLSAAIFVWPSLPARIIGVSSPELMAASCRAVRIVSVSYVFFSVSALMTSYCLFIGRGRISFAIVTLQEAVYPVVGCFAGVALAGADGFWTGYMLAAPLALLTVGAFLALRPGEAHLPFLLPHDRDADLRTWSIAKLTETEACRVAQEVRRELQRRHVEPKYLVRGAMLVEDTLVETVARNGGRTVDAEVTLDLNDGVRLTFRDGGTMAVAARSLTADDAFRAEMLGRLGRTLAGSSALVTTGFNRKTLKL